MCYPFGSFEIGYIELLIKSGVDLGQESSENKAPAPRLEGKIEISERADNSQLDQPTDVREAREASVEERDSALDRNPDKHNGSAGDFRKELTKRFINKDNEFVIEGKVPAKFIELIGAAK
jgi:hypothetical protein